MYCANCGEKLLEGALFCTECGSKIVIYTQVLDLSEEVQNEKEQNEETFQENMIEEVEEESQVRGESENYIEEVALAKEEPDQQKKGKNKKKFLGIIGAISAILLIGAVVGVSLFQQAQNKRREALEQRIQQFEEVVISFDTLDDIYDLGEKKEDYLQTLSIVQRCLDEKRDSKFDAYTEKMNDITNEIKTYNDALKTDFDSVHKEYVEIADAYVLGDLSEGYNALLNKANDCQKQNKYQEMMQLMNEMKQNKEEIVARNQAMKEYVSLYDEYENQSENYLFDTDEYGNYQSLMNSLLYAINVVDKAEAENCKNSLDSLFELVKKKNGDQFEEMYDNVKSFDMDQMGMLEEEKAQFLACLEEGTNAYQSENYKVAYDKLNECILMADKFYQAKNYSMEIQQYDVTNFPHTKLYFTITDLNTQETIETLDSSCIDLYEKIGNKGEYQRVDIEEAHNIDQKEKLNIALCADVSASMGEEGIYQSALAMSNLLGCMQTGIGDRAALYTFADTVYRDAYFTSDIDYLNNAIWNITTGNLTALYDALAYSLSEIIIEDGAKCIIAFTDGMENNSLTSKEYIIKKAQTFHVPIYLIGIGEYVDTYSLQEIAELTGGFYVNVYDVSDIESIYQQIYRNQKSMYMIEYKSKEKKKTDKVRDIYVAYDDGEKTIRTQFSYTPDNFKISGFVFFDSDSRYLTEDDLDQLTEAEVRIALNEIYARRGYIFQTAADMISHFEDCSWYTGTNTSMEEVYKTFNQYEKANVQLLVDYEVKNKLNGRAK